MAPFTRETRSPSLPVLFARSFCSFRLSLASPPASPHSEASSASGRWHCDVTEDGPFIRTGARSSRFLGSAVWVEWRVRRESGSLPDGQMSREGGCVAGGRGA